MAHDRPSFGPTEGSTSESEKPSITGSVGPADESRVRERGRDGTSASPPWPAVLALFDAEDPHAVRVVGLEENSAAIVDPESARNVFVAEEHLLIGAFG